MLNRVLVILGASVAFGYLVGELIVRTPGMFGVGAQFGVATGCVMAPIAVLCLWRKPLWRGLSWWLGSTGVAVAVLSIVAPPWLVLVLGFLVSFIAAAVVLVELENEIGPRPNACERCGYGLITEGDGLCPECGQRWRAVRGASGGTSGGVSGEVGGGNEARHE